MYLSDIGTLKYLFCYLRDKTHTPCRKLLVFKTEHRKQKWRTQANDSVCPGKSASSHRTEPEVRAAEGGRGRRDFFVSLF